MQSKKFIEIKPISKIEFGKRSDAGKWGQANLTNIASRRQISLTKIFDDYITDPENLERTYELIRDKKIVPEVDFIFAREGLRWIGETFKSANSFLNAPDLIFAYRVLRVTYRIYSATYPDWKFNLGETPGYYANDFAPMQFDPHSYEVFSKNRENDLIAQMILKELDQQKIQDSIVSIQFFWSAEIMQALLIAEHLKKHGNIVILDATYANEQVDYTQWIKSIQEENELFKNIDYYIPYQDYGEAMKKIVHIVNAGVLPEDANLTNVLYRDSKGDFMPFVKPGIPDSNELFQRFCEYYHRESDSNNPHRSSIRLFPYKCYWSGCFFCTINSTHLYPYDPNDSDRYIHAAIDYIVKINGTRISFNDEAISPKDLIAFANEVLRRNLKFIYRVRTRFDASYTKEVCELLYRSWLRFAGIGLESANPEMNTSINKGHNLSKDQIQEIIENFNAAGVAFHNYSIMGFPHETIEQIGETFEFLLSNINSQANYNCTPNVFGLNKGSYMHKHPEKFELSTVMDSEGRKNLLNLRHTFSEEKEKKEIMRKYQSEIHRAQFLPWVEKDSKSVDFWNFWIFIDRTSHYYAMKTIYTKSPFFVYRDINNELLEKSDEEILDTKIYISPYIQIFKTQTPGKYRIYNWVEFDHIYADDDFVKFIQNFDANKTLKENIKTVEMDDEDILFRILLKKRFFLSEVGLPEKYIEMS